METLINQSIFPSSMEAHWETKSTIVGHLLNLDEILKEETTIVSEDAPVSDYNSKKYKTLLSNLRSWRQS